MTTQTGTEASVWKTKTKALAAALMLTAVMAMSVLAPAPAQASAFPGANGKIVFASTRTTGAGVDNPEADEEIFSMNPDGTALKQLTKNKVTDSSPSFSSDGKKIVYHSFPGGNADVFVMNADGSGKKNLTKNPASDFRPSFSPDGKKVLFDSARSGPSNTDVFVMNADGTDQTDLTPNDPQRDENATFSPDGKKIAFVSDRGSGNGEIFLMNADGSGQTSLTPIDTATQGDPAFSPDGSKIVFSSNRFGGGDPQDFDILVMGADGSNPINLTGSRATDDNPAFSPDGSKIAFVSTRDGGDRDVFVMEATSGTNQTDVTPNVNTDSAPDWQPKGVTFTVNTASDPGDGVCDGNQCTLREAINASNGVLGQIPNNIRFDIPGSGVQTITPTSDLPAITRPVVVDGYTQPGASPNTLATGGTNAALKIEINGTNTSQSGLMILGTSNSAIRGLVINRFAGTEIALEGATGSRIEGNFLGTDPTGTLESPIKGFGVSVQGGTSGNTVGGTTPAARNLISGNDEGIEFASGSQGNRVLGNLIGTTASGTAPLGNDFWGVAMFSPFTSDNRIGDGTAAGSNTIAFNGKDGIEIDFASATGHRISRNSVFSNGGLGIDLIGGIETDTTDVHTPNDAGDADAGPNGLQNKPALTSAKTSSTKTTIAGKLNSTPGKTFKIEFFRNPKDTDEGKTFIGQKSVTTDASGNATYTFSPAAKVLAGQTITATATGPGGNTSEFSAPRAVATS